MIKDVFTEEATTGRTLRNIKNTLKERLKDYNFNADEIEDKANELLKIHGLHKDSFDFIKNIDQLFNQELNETSIDDNSNKNEKTVSGIVSESTLPANKAIGFDYLYRQMVNDWGKKEAKRLSGLLYDYSLGLADSTNILKPYCWGFETSKLVFEGRPFGQLHSKPPKSIHSYTNMLNETIHHMSNHLAGAIAVPLMLIDYCYLLLNYENVPLWKLKISKKVRKYVENNMQSFVHSVNHLSRVSSESPFSNISIFDSVKLQAYLSDDNLWWVFEQGNKKYTKEYIIKYVMELQDIFLNFFDKGDPIHDGMPYRFPVLTLQLAKNTNGKPTIMDKKFLDYISNKEIFRYNIFISEGLRVASCCRLINNNELMSMGGQSNSFGASSGMGSHRVNTVNYNRLALEATSYDHFKALSIERIHDCVKILKSHKNLLYKLTDAGLQPFIRRGWIRLDRSFSTIGVMGTYEADKTLKYKFPELKNTDITEEILVQLENLSHEYSKEYDLIVNQEQIPGESFAVRLASADRILYGKELVPFELYANQFIPLWEDVTIYERMKKDGFYNLKLSGGGIVHFNLGERPTKTQIKKLINFAVESGCEHFALNALYCMCENRHASFGENKTCPVCGGEIIDKLTRVVGFFTPVSSWNTIRKNWEFPKRKFKRID